MFEEHGMCKVENPHNRDKIESPLISKENKQNTIHMEYKECHD